VVGVSDYSHLPELGPVPFADRDAIAFADYLVQSGQVTGREDLVTLINGQATIEEVMTQLLLLKRRVAARSLHRQRVVLFFAGHSLIEGDNPDGGNVTLLLSDTPENWYWNHALRLQDLQGIVAALSMEYGVEVMLYLDVAHAPEAAMRERIGRQLHTQFTREVKFLSAFPGQPSLASPALGGGHGLFSYFLMRGLRGAADQYQGDGDGSVEAGELEDYLLENILDYSAERQQPLMVGNRLAVLATYQADPFAEEPAAPPALTTKGAPDAAAPAAIATGDPCGIAGTEQRKEAFYQAMFSGRWFSGGCDALALYHHCPAGLERAEMRYRLANAVNWQAGQLLLEYRRDELAGRPAVALDTMAGRLELAMQMLPPEEVLHNTLRSRRAFFRAMADMKRKEGPGEASIALLEEAVQLDPYSAPAYYALGMAHHRRNDGEPALRRLRQAAVLSPAWAKPHEALPELEALAAATSSPAATAVPSGNPAPPARPAFAWQASAHSNAISTPLPAVVSTYVYPQLARRNADAGQYGFTWLGPQASGYSVQLGAFQSYEYALQELQRLKTVSHQPVFLQLRESSTAPPVYRLLLGRFAEALQAEGVRKYLQEKGFDATIISVEALAG
jgi:hypothetical protein